MNPDEIHDSPNNLVDLFEQSVIKWPDIRFFGGKNQESGQYEWLTRRQIAVRVDHLRGALAKLGLSKGDKVGIIIIIASSGSSVNRRSTGWAGYSYPCICRRFRNFWKYIISDAAIKFLFVGTRASTKKSKISSRKSIR